MLAQSPKVARSRKEISIAYDPCVRSYSERFEEWWEFVESQAEWAEALGNQATFFDAHPELFRRYWRHIVSTRDRKKSSIRRGTSRAWYPNKKPRYIRYHVARHLEGHHKYWVGMPHGEETRNVTIDIDNHDDWLSKDFSGLSLAYLKKLKRFHGALPRSKPWLWCVTSKSWGINILLDIGRPRASAEVHRHYKDLLKRLGLEAEVYPWGGHNHRLPFGQDYIVLAEAGPITEAAEMIDFYLSPRISATWEAIFDGLLSSWLLGAERHPGCRHKVKGRLDEINEWELEGFPIDQVKGIPPSRSTSPPSPVPSSVPSVGWDEYKESFGRGQGSWVRLIVDLARNGVPVQDDLYRPLTELAKWLLHVEFYDLEPELRLSRTTDLLMG